MKKFTLNIPAGVIEVDHENSCGHEGIFGLSKERIDQIVELAYPINIKCKSWTEFLEGTLDAVKPENANEILFIFFLFGRFYADAQPLQTTSPRPTSGAKQSAKPRKNPPARH